MNGLKFSTDKRVERAKQSGQFWVGFLIQPTFFSMKLFSYMTNQQTIAQVYLIHNKCIKTNVSKQIVKPCYQCSALSTRIDYAYQFVYTHFHWNDKKKLYFYPFPMLCVVW